jgi:DNA-binding response OmpR family regulator
VQGVGEHEVIRENGLELHLAAHEARLDGESLELTFMEYELLKFLITHPARAFSREALLTSVWGYDFFGGARTVDVHAGDADDGLGSMYT